MSAFSRIIPAVLLLGIGTALYADTATPSTPAPAPAAKPVAKLTPAQIKARAEEVGAQLEGDYQAVLKLQAVAKKKADVIKLNCVNDRLLQLKAEMNIAGDTRATIKGTEDAETLQTLHRDVEDQASSAAKLREEATTCIGETELYKQESGNEVNHPDFPDDPGVTDPTAPTDSVDVEPPGYASPYT